MSVRIDVRAARVMLIGVDHRNAPVTPVIMLVRIRKALAIIVKGTIEHVVGSAYSKPFKLRAGSYRTACRG